MARKINKQHHLAQNAPILSETFTQFPQASSCISWTPFPFIWIQSSFILFPIFFMLENFTLKALSKAFWSFWRVYRSRHIIISISKQVLLTIEILLNTAKLAKFQRKLLKTEFVIVEAWKLIFSSFDTAEKKLKQYLIKHHANSRQKR